jgi:large subunit ribosomal protein L35Ae
VVQNGDMVKAEDKKENNPLSLFLGENISVEPCMHAYILRFPGIESVGGAARLLGRKVGWPVGKHEARGKIVALHGKKGLVRARFRKGVPGQALGSLVEIIG